jgi:hypothetical protein
MNTTHSSTCLPLLHRSLTSNASPHCPTFVSLPQSRHFLSLSLAAVALFLLSGPPTLSFAHSIVPSTPTFVSSEPRSHSSPPPPLRFRTDGQQPRQKKKKKKKKKKKREDMTRQGDDTVIPQAKNHLAHLKLSSSCARPTPATKNSSFVQEGLSLTLFHDEHQTERSAGSAEGGEHRWIVSRLFFSLQKSVCPLLRARR